jgi:hypothetical protein
MRHALRTASDLLLQAQMMQSDWMLCNHPLFANYSGDTSLWGLKIRMPHAADFSPPDVNTMIGNRWSRHHFTNMFEPNEAHQHNPLTL